MPLVVHQLFSVSTPSDHEVFTTLASGKDFRLERIESFGHASPIDFWYDQPEAEWVLLARGTAILMLSSGERVELQAGDYFLLPAGLRHRVASTSTDAIWLALHFTLDPS